jgi:hypothetical protein
MGRCASEPVICRHVSLRFAEAGSLILVVHSNLVFALAAVVCQTGSVSASGVCG